MFSNDFLEFLNLYISILDFFLVGMFFAYLFKSRWWSGPGSGLALALMLGYLGHGMIRGWTWFWRFNTQHHLFQENLVDSIPVLPIGLMIVTVSVALIGRQISQIISLWLWIIVIIVSAEVAAFVA